MVTVARSLFLEISSILIIEVISLNIKQMSGEFISETYLIPQNNDCPLLWDFTPVLFHQTTEISRRKHMDVSKQGLADYHRSVVEGQLLWRDLHSCFFLAGENRPRETGKGLYSDVRHQKGRMQCKEQRNTKKAT